MIFLKKWISNVKQNVLQLKLNFVLRLNKYESVQAVTCKLRLLTIEKWIL